MPVKNYIIIFFLSIYSFATFHLDEYFKIPILVEHFNEHKIDNSKLSLLDFILDHYALGEALDIDNDKDLKLPFKSHNCACTSNSIITFLSHIQVFTFNNTITFIDFKKPTFGYNFSFISSFYSSIWQPPKINLFKIS